MHLFHALVGAAALWSTSALGSSIPSSDLEARSELESRAYHKTVDQCRKDLSSYSNYKFCKSFIPTKTIIVKKTAVVKKGTKTIYNTRKAPCTTRGSYSPPHYGKREPEVEYEALFASDAESAAHAEAYFAKRDAMANPEAAADADAEANYIQYRNKRCHRRGVPLKLRKYPCKVIKRACRAYYTPRTRTKTVSRACRDIANMLRALF
jgi:hypothetical protein